MAKRFLVTTSDERTWKREEKIGRFLEVIVADELLKDYV
jgi:hypothetical protein